MAHHGRASSERKHLYMKKLVQIALSMLLCLLPMLCPATEKVGVVLMHGKSPGGPDDPSLSSLVGKMNSAGMVVLVPNMPWSRQRYIDVPWETAMVEIDNHVKQLRAEGATRIVLAGHSMGCPAAMSYAANRKGVDAIVLLAPGHSPLLYYQGLPQAPFRSWVVKESIDKAREMVASQRGDEANVSFGDINQGRRAQVWTTPRTFLSYFEPNSDAEMSVTAPRVPPEVPVLWVIGDGDSLIKLGRDYVFNKLPPNPHSKYLEISANHLSTPAKAADQVIEWLRTTLSAK